MRGRNRLEQADYVVQTVGTKGAKGTELGEGERVCRPGDGGGGGGQPLMQTSSQA